MKKIIHTLKSSSLMIIFLIIVTLTLLIALTSSTKKDLNYIYVKVKIGQGLWWANTSMPNSWLADAIKPGDAEYSLTGKKTVEVVEVKKYPYFQTNNKQSSQYVVFLTLKIQAKKGKKNHYTFNRSSLNIGTPIDLNLSSAEVTGTVIDISENPIISDLHEKTITLTKQFSDPWEFEAIKIGDQFHDGNQKVFEIVSKSTSATNTLTIDPWGNSFPPIKNQAQYITLQAKILVSNNDLGIFYAEEQQVSVGNYLNIATSNFNYSNFVIGNIE